MTEKRLSGKTQKFLTTFRQNRYMFAMVWKEKSGRAYFAVNLLASLFDILPTLVNTLIPGLILTELLGEQRIPVIALYVGIQVGMPVVDAVFKRFVSCAARKLFYELRASFQTRMDLRMARARLELFENATFQNQKELVNGAYVNPQKVIHNVVWLIAAVAKLAVMIGIITSVNVLVAVVVVAVVLLDSRVTRWQNQVHFARREKIVELERYEGFVAAVFDDQATGKLIRLYQMKDMIENRLADARRELKSLHRKDAADDQNAGIAKSFLQALQQGYIYVYVIYGVRSGSFSIGTMSIYMSAANQINSILSQIAGIYMSMAADGLIYEEVRKFEEMQAEEESGKRGVQLDAHSVFEFRDVSFRYAGAEQYAIRHLDLKIPVSEKLCLVGENGAGKTTLIHLLMRLYTPTEGEILLDGINIREYDLGEYRRIFSPVQQNPGMYFLPVRENIVLNGKYDEKRLEETCVKANLEKFVAKLEKGFDTPLFKLDTDGGINPSGGESQRIAIARAIYRDSSVYILDEPTAALDPSSEYEIYARFHEVIGNRCAVMITHRLSGVQLADRVALMRNGHIVESGTHRELYEKGGIYTEMFDKQASFYVHSRVREFAACAAPDWHSE